MELCDRSASELASMIEEGEVSSREITNSVLQRIAEKEGTVNAYVSLTEEQTLKQADLADERISTKKNVTPLTGIPIAVKDNICTQGIKTTCGSNILNNYIPPYNATVVQKLLDAGAVIVGKTNLDEFGMGSSTEKSANGVTRNPIDPDYVPGGSSGGSAAAVAAGETILALGTDTGGSIRMPAAFCGVAGFKPTYGRVSRYGLVSYASSLDQIGSIARTVKDCANLLNIICGYDKKDSTSANIPVPDFTNAVNKNIKGLKIGLPKEYFIEGLDQHVKEKINSAIQLYQNNGAEICDVSLPHTRYAVSTYYLIATAEASSNLARFDGVKYGFREKEDVQDLGGMYEITRGTGFGKEVKRRIMLGSYVLSAGYYDAYYLKAQKVRSLIKDDFDQALSKVDCLLTPVTPNLPFKLGEKSADPLQMYLEDIYTVSLNLAGLPGICINCGEAEGLPVGFQLIGKAFDESTLIKAASGYEQLVLNKKNN